MYYLRIVIIFGLNVVVGNIIQGFPLNLEHFIHPGPVPFGSQPLNRAMLSSRGILAPVAREACENQYWGKRVGARSHNTRFAQKNCICWKILTDRKQNWTPALFYVNYVKLQPTVSMFKNNSKYKPTISCDGLSLGGCQDNVTAVLLSGVAVTCLGALAIKKKEKRLLLS